MHELATGLSPWALYGVLPQKKPERQLGGVPSRPTSSCLGCGCPLSLAVPGLVFVAGLAELANGITRLNHSFVVIDPCDGRGEDKVCIREIRMTEDRARQVFPRPQFLVTAGDFRVARDSLAEGVAGETAA
jgi:hypothetical protein